MRRPPWYTLILRDSVRIFVYGSLLVVAIAVVVAAVQP
jgi:hypothetical protein